MENKDVILKAVNDLAQAEAQMERAMGTLKEMGITYSHINLMAHGNCEVFLHRGIRQVAEALGQRMQIRTLWAKDKERAEVEYRGLKFVQYPKEIRKEYE